MTNERSPVIYIYNYTSFLFKYINVHGMKWTSQTMIYIIQKKPFNKMIPKLLVKQKRWNFQPLFSHSEMNSTATETVLPRKFCYWYVHLTKCDPSLDMVIFIWCSFVHDCRDSNKSNAPAAKYICAIYSVMLE